MKHFISCVFFFVRKWQTTFLYCQLHACTGWVGVFTLRQNYSSSQIALEHATYLLIFYLLWSNWFDDFSWVFPWNTLVIIACEKNHTNREKYRNLLQERVYLNVHKVKTSIECAILQDGGGMERTGNLKNVDNFGTSKVV